MGTGVRKEEVGAKEVVSIWNTLTMKSVEQQGTGTMVRCVVQDRYQHAEHCKTRISGYDRLHALLQLQLSTGSAAASGRATMLTRKCWGSLGLPR